MTETLEQENARLKNMLRRAGITPLTLGDLPTEEQAAELIRMVETAHPILRNDLPDTLDQFARAMRYLAHVYRKPEPNTGVMPSYWLDSAREWLSNQGFNGTVTLKPFVAAVIASNIPYTAPSRYPWDLSFGISLGSVSRPSNAWREVLANGVPRPTMPRNALPTRQLHQLLIVRPGEPKHQPLPAVEGPQE